MHPGSLNPYAVHVRVYECLGPLRAAATRWDRIRGSHNAAYQPQDHSTTMGLCHRFEYQPPGASAPDPTIALVRLAAPHLGVGIVSHELAHAAVWIRELELDRAAPSEYEECGCACGCSCVRLEAANDEDFCWILGELVSSCVQALYDAGVYEPVRISISE